MVCFLFGAQLVWAQNATVKISHLACKQQLSEPTLQALNGNLNVSIGVCNGVLLQFAEIPAKLVQCNAKVGSSQYKAILIDEVNGKTYQARNKNRNALSISCNNNQLIFNFKGKLYNKRKCVNVQATITGAVPHSNNEIQLKQ